MSRFCFILGVLLIWLPCATASGETIRFADREYRVDTLEMIAASGFTTKKVHTLRIRNVIDSILGTRAERIDPEIELSRYEIDDTGGVSIVDVLPSDWYAQYFFFPKMSAHDLAGLVDPCFSSQEKQFFSDKNAEVVIRVLVNDTGAIQEVTQSLTLEGELYSGSLVPFFRIDQMLRTHLSYEDNGEFKRVFVPWGPTTLWLDFPEGKTAVRVIKYGNITPRNDNSYP